MLHAEDGELESALRISELARDRSLGDLFAEQEWRRQKLPAAERAPVDALTDQIQSLDEAIAATPEIVARVRLEAQRTLAVAERGRLESALGERLGLARPGAAPPTLAVLREHLPDRTALISVLHAGGRWWALVIKGQEPARFVPLQDPDIGLAASAWVRRLRGEPVRAWPMAGGRLALGDGRPAGATGGYLSPAALGERLSRSLLTPLLQAAGNATRLVFVGDEDLAGVPLQALPFAGGLLLDRYVVTYAPSLSTYARWQAPRPGRVFPRDLLALGGIDYPPVDAARLDDPIAREMQAAAEHPLPLARQEVEDITGVFPARRVTAWTGAAASKEALHEASRSGALAGYRYAHLATHAWSRQDEPEASAIVLAGPPSDPPARRALTAAELAGLRMGSDMLVLSACDTGSGRFEHGRGLLGLASAALAAGNRSALVSLWAVADDTTAHFMKRLYGYLRAGREPAQALADTQRAFRRSPEPRLADPLAWAPFVLYGGY